MVDDRMIIDGGGGPVVDDAAAPYAWASLALGLVSVPLAFVPFVGLVSFLLAGVGIVSGVLALRRDPPINTETVARYGIGLGIVGMAIASVEALVIALLS